MRRQRAVEVCGAGTGFIDEHVEPGADPALVHCRDQSGLIDDVATGGIEKDGAVFHLSEEVGADKPLGVGGAWYMQRDNVGTDEEFAEIVDIADAGAFGAGDGIV